jgi:HEPN domain-containing protein
MSASGPTWLGYAKADLEAARILCTSSNPDNQWNNVAFHCQQAGEKVLKAFLIGRGWVLQKTHDVAKLLDEAEKHDPVFRALRPDADLLNTFVQAGRYPLSPVRRSEAESALVAADRIFAAVFSAAPNLNI